jgi:hypothetical protein
MFCAMTGQSHRLFWMRSAWWCSECRQKIESCCEGGGCASVVEVLGPVNADAERECAAAAAYGFPAPEAVPD